MRRAFLSLSVIMLLCGAATGARANIYGCDEQAYSCRHKIALLGRQRDEMFRLDEKAAKDGDPEAQYNLASDYKTGAGTQPNMGEAIKWYKKASAQGFFMADRELGFIYAIGLGVRKDFRESARWLKRAAKAGEPMSQAVLGTMYENGTVLARDLDTAFALYQAAAKKGDRLALYHLGRCYEQGLGTAPDAAEAMKDYQTASTLGFVPADTAVGGMFEKGEGVTANESLAASWYDRAARAGDGDALYRLGLYYDAGRGGLKQDGKKAVEYWEQAADANQHEAQFALAKAYIEGRNVPQDYSKAHRLLAPAGLSGDSAPAAALLAKLFERGLGDAKSPFDAYFWYTIAAYIDPRYEGRREALGDTLPPSRKALAEHTAAPYLAAIPRYKLKRADAKDSPEK
ncbi:MAG: hypothetical protein GC185_04835 [Alphaproteobacteria bacterium]|nr:hypothetical protein [Alphaproteobacteria bacterium]